MDRTIFTPEHDAFRSLCRDFFSREAAPHTERWEKEGIVDRQIWLEAGKHGLLGFDVPEEYGGAGISDFRYNAILAEEIANTGTVGVGFTLQNDVVAPYLIKLTNDEQKARWLPGFASGEIITAIAMTEPGAGSDLQGVATTARRDGDHYVVNGSKTFITNGILSDLVIVVAKTDPSAGHKGMSLLAVERGMPGFERGRNLDKAGMKSQDTAELFFNDVRVPAANLIGEEGRGFYHLMMSLPQERLSIAVAAVAGAERALALTIAYCKDRKAFGTPIGSFQNTRFVARRDADRATGRAQLHRPVHPRAQRRQAHRGRGIRRQVLDHRPAGQGRRPVRATAWRLRLHDRVRSVQAVARRPGPADLRRHQRDHEGDRRTGDGLLIGAGRSVRSCLGPIRPVA